MYGWTLILFLCVGVGGAVILRVVELIDGPAGAICETNTRNKGIVARVKMPPMMAKATIPGFIKRLRQQLFRPLQ